jgi:hypothetical protein
MEAASIYKTTVTFYQTSRPNNPEDSHRKLLDGTVNKTTPTASFHKRCKSLFIDRVNSTLYSMAWAAGSVVNEPEMNYEYGRDDIAALATELIISSRFKCGEEV